MLSSCHALVVSILIQPEDRMQAEASELLLLSGCEFQSSSSPKTGCKSQHSQRLADLLGEFQSSSSPKTGCKWAGDVEIEVSVEVSILIQPEDRMQEDSAPCITYLGSIVSILIQPEDRMQGINNICSTALSLFQSSSSPKTGCKASTTSVPLRYLCFNPHPARRPDAS